MFEECTIESDHLPHGDLDIIAGTFDPKGELSWKIAVQLIPGNEFTVSGPVGISAKTRHTLSTDPPSKLTL